MIHTLLSSSQGEEAVSLLRKGLPPEIQCDQTFSFTDSQIVTLQAVQASLHAHEIEAELPQIANALLEALATRPALCRGLIAAYLLGA